MVPRAISERVRFRLRDSTGQFKALPPPVFTALEIDQARQCRLSLDPPQVGNFEVVAEFDVERIADTTGDEASPVDSGVAIVGCGIRHHASEVEHRKETGGLAGRSRLEAGTGGR